MSETGAEEVPVDADLARRLVAEQFPQWAHLPVVPVPRSGMDNATFRLGREMTVRMPRFERWAEQVEREQRWLPFLAPQLPLPVSRPIAKGEPGSGYPFSWSVCAWLEGEAVGGEELADPERAALDLAEFIRALHKIDASGGPGPRASNAFRGVPMGDPRDSIAVEERVRPKIEALEGLVDTDRVRAVWEEALAAPPWEGPEVWIHGDLAAGNLLAVEGRLSAVIDFGTVAVGDPACDLLPAWKFLPPRVRGVFREAVGVDEATWARGRGWGLASSLPVPDDPYFASDPRRVESALRELDEILGDLP
ncbi:aminoglycoside phosphotransferase family protein [Nocardiopsis baichengensis]|uniref:aminoglycoside phosphotransferase family protein n=1 Tax=Nocardiopsis baichengensis TaxID=280240 RepID=UPI00034D23A7|nr:aminoglycoside phosphotransferase family protein [Nocardiopsis baichengensis]